MNPLHSVVTSDVLAQRLERSIWVSALTEGTAIAGLAIIYAFFAQATVLAVLMVALTLHAGLLVLLHRLVRRQALALAATTFCVLDWLVVVVVALVAPQAGPALTPVVIMRLVMVLPYLGRPALPRLVAGAALASALITLFARSDVFGLLDPVPAIAITVFIVVFAGIVGVVVGFELDQHAVGWRATAEQALEANEEVARQAEELRRSRARVVAAADDERRRIERDLHDGAQQSLVSVGIHLNVLADSGALDPPVREQLMKVAGIADHAIDELRRLAHGIYPPELVANGLSAALAGIAERSPLTVHTDVALDGRLPAELEATVYFCCLEALQNAEKHARGPVVITVAAGPELRFEVTDAGPGFDPADAPQGRGLANLRDRVGAIFGTLVIDSAPGRGTRVLGRIPLLVAAG